MTETEPMSVPVSPGEPPEFVAAAAAWRRGDHATAASICAALVDEAPQFGEGHNLLGLANLGLNRPKEAYAAFEQALKLTGRADIHNNAALVAKALGETDRAFDHFLDALRLNPDYAAAHANFGRFLRQEGNGGGAVAHLERALQLDANQVNALTDLAAISYDRGRYDQAVGYLTRWVLWQAPRIRRIADEAPSTVSPKTKPLPFAAALNAIADLLEANGVPFFLGDGTLLGFVRDGDFIAHDKDIDLGLFDDIDRARILAMLERSPEFWLDAYRDDGDADLMITTRYRDQVAIDLFFYKSRGNDMLHGMGQRDAALLWRQSGFTLRPARFLGRRFDIPTPPERYLEELYGPQWHIVDKDYCSYLTGELIGGLPLYARLQGLLALQNAIGNKRRTFVVKLCQRLLERLPEAPEEMPLRSALGDIIRRQVA